MIQKMLMRLMLILCVSWPSMMLHAAETPSCQSLLNECKVVMVKQYLAIQSLNQERTAREAMISEQEHQLVVAREDLKAAKKRSVWTVLGAGLLLIIKGAIIL